MDRHEQLRPRGARAAHPLAQRQEDISVTGQDRAHTGLAVDTRGQLLGDVEHDDFFLGAAGAYRAGILTAVTRIDRDDDDATARGRRMGGLDRLERHRLRRGDLRHGDGVFACAHLEHQPLTEQIARQRGLQRGTGPGLQLDDHPQDAVGLRTGAHADHAALGGGHRCGHASHPLQIEHGPARTLQGEEPMRRGVAEVEKHTGDALLGDHPDRLQLTGVERRGAQEERADCERHKHPAQGRSAQVHRAVL